MSRVTNARRPDPPSTARDEPGPTATGAAREPSAAARRFADPSVVVQSWYVAGRSGDLPRGGVLRARPAGRDLVLWRGLDGRVSAADARCPHLGAHLGHGHVEGNDLACALHHFRFAADGTLVAAPGVSSRPSCRLHTHPVTERWGFVWVWHGPRALHPLPGPADGERLRILAFPEQRFRCHHHLIAVNACDTLHLGPLHGLELAEPPVVTIADDFRATMRLRGRFKTAWKKRITGCDRHDFDALFTVSGGNQCWVAVSAPVPFQVIFAGRPDGAGGSITRSLLFLPPGSTHRAWRVLALLLLLLKRDHEILDDLAFVRGFTDADDVLARFVRHIDAMPIA